MDAPARSISFEPLAHCYDATRGGLERGGAIAAALAPWVGPGDVLEVGVGTGAVALPLGQALGRGVVGVDLSPAMLRQAQERLGPAVAIGDGAALPVPTASVGAIVIVWVLQLVPDVAAVLAECARCLQPGGRLLVVPAGGVRRHDDIEEATKELFERLRPPDHGPETVRRLGAEAGLQHVHTGRSAEQEWNESPADIIELVRERRYSALLHLDDEGFQRLAQPIIDALAALPDPDRSRRRAASQQFVVLARHGG